MELIPIFVIVDPAPDITASVDWLNTIDPILNNVVLAIPVITLLEALELPIK